MNMTTKAIRKKKACPKYIEVESSHYQEDLIEALCKRKQPVWFYKVDEDILPALPKDEYKSVEMYDPFGGSGLPAYIVSYSELTPEDKLKVAREIAARMS
jgi:hypothetical protein